MFYTFFHSAPEEGLYCKPKYRENLFKYILLVLAILFFVTSPVRISLPSVFCISQLEHVKGSDTRDVFRGNLKRGLGFQDAFLPFVYISTLR